jgi:hypothetical protein
MLPNQWQANYQLSSISIDIAILSQIVLSSSTPSLRQQRQTPAFIYLNQPDKYHYIQSISQPPKITSPTFNMQYSIVFLSAMAATGSLAAPQAVEVTNAIDVLLSSPDLESNSATRFVEGIRDAQLSANKFVASDTVELRVGPDVEQQNVRCQILDAQDEPILVFRDPNFDFTFADGNGGPWTLVDGAQLVKTIVCDPEFVGNPLDLGIKVTLSDGNLATQTEFEHFGLLEEKSPVGSSGPFNTVALTLGADVSDQNLRCQIIDDKGDAIELVRGNNEAFTFADGGAGAWTFLDPASSVVEKIICDPLF